jgi:hypothetical protein
MPVPQVAQYLPPPSEDIPPAIAAQEGACHLPWHQFLTIAGTLAVVNSVLIGGVPGLAVQAGTRRLAASAAAGVITGAAALAVHLTPQRATWRAAAQQSAPTAQRQAIEDPLPGGWTGRIGAACSGGGVTGGERPGCPADCRR